jgi:hypothetical protein
MSGRNKKILLIAGAVLLAVGASFLADYLIDRSEEKKGAEEENVLIHSPEEMGAGTIGEVKIKDEELGEEKPIVSGETPAQIYTTDGNIQEVKENGIIVWGSGTNFADKTSRDLTVLVSEETIIYGQGVPFGGVKGLEGLKYLKRGDYIVVDGESNIRGKTTFFAIRIKKL